MDLLLEMLCEFVFEVGFEAGLRAVFGLSAAEGHARRGTLQTIFSEHLLR